ncbi:hypothetical protein QUW45_08895 [Limosilactobacillus pontis]|uniref:hypothetical protein n=1 Tax=Limosilactobacillus pontis TaxID=35787 RepID=UPI0025A4B2F4|nr:hypothetical protein [Limosilactobacillus pontis]MDM8332773.1 hypothetical protein [Limosilactobacillus pontis]
MVFISLVGLIVVILVGIWLVVRHRRKVDFDMTPRDRNGTPIDDSDEEDEDNDPAEAPIYDDDLTYDDWLPWENLLQEIGIVDIRDGMIEYETGDNSRLFIMLAEMGQSNPYLKTDEELANNNQIMEVFYNSVMAPLKETSQSQRVEMNDFLNSLKKHSQYLRGANEQMKQYAEHVIDDTLQYQQATDRFENKCYLQFLAVVTPDEVFGETPKMLEEQVHEKAMEKLTRQITRANGLLKRADHPLSPLDTFGLIEVIYKTFNRDSSVKIRLEDIVKDQRFTWYTTAHQNDKTFKKIKQRIQIEADAINAARDALMEQSDINGDEGSEETTTDSDNSNPSMEDLSKLD